jgi:transposase
MSVIPRADSDGIYAVNTIAHVPRRGLVSGGPGSCRVVDKARRREHVFPLSVRCGAENDPMEKAALELLLAQGHSLADIGRRFGRHESTIAYWVQKHGLAAVNRQKHLAKGPLTREQLTPLVEAGMSIAEIALALGRGKAGIRHWLDKFGLKTHWRTAARLRAGEREAREAGLTRAVVSCPHHRPTEHILEPRGYYRCGACRQQAVIRRRRKAKAILVREAGGRCQLCGYDRSQAALQFHHLDPAAKEFGVARRGARGIDRLRAEIQKCILLCSNCHAEVENGFTSVPG